MSDAALRRAAPFDVDADITIASTLGKAFYLDPAWLERSRDRVFARSWQWLGTLDDVAEPGSLAPRDLLPGLLDEPLLLSRDTAGALRCLSNVCTHRGNRLVNAPCHADHIRCGYHSRRFDLDGRLRFMPEFEQARDFPSSRDDLPQVALGGWGGQAFASLAPAAPLAHFIGDMQQRLAWLPMSAHVHAPALDRDYVVAAHWALYVENYLESLHIPFVHPGLGRALDLGRYRHECHRHAHLQLAEARDGEAAFEPPAGSVDHGRRVAAYYWWIFPNLMLNFYPWGLSVNLVQPQGVDRTRVLFRSYVRDASRLGEGAGGALDEVEREDEAVVEAVQRGLRSRLYLRGRYSPSRETGVHQFHRLLGEFMGEPAPDGASPRAGR